MVPVGSPILTKNHIYVSSHTCSTAARGLVAGCICLICPPACDIWAVPSSKFLR